MSEASPTSETAADPLSIFIRFPYILAVWTSFSYCGPAVGPVLSAFAIPVLGWRWSLWEILIISGPIWVLMFLCMPEVCVLACYTLLRLYILNYDRHLRTTYCTDGPHDSEH